VQAPVAIEGQEQRAVDTLTLRVHEQHTQVHETFIRVRGREVSEGEGIQGSDDSGGPGVEELRQQLERLQITGRRRPTLEEQSNPGDHRWGDTIGIKDQANLRVGLVNLNGFPMSAKAKKLADIKGFMLAYEFDVMGFTEMNVHWNSVDNASRLELLTKGWFALQNRATAYFEKHPFPAPFMYGGVSQWVLENTVHRVVEVGGDPAGLGRWAWHRLTGRQGVVLRIVTAYRPVAGRGPRSVWMQQKNFFLAQDEAGDPRQLFIRDLKEQVQGWLQAGEQLMVNMDANEDVSRGELARVLTDLGLVELVTAKHGVGPATYQRGVVPIDGMFVTPMLRGCQCGYVEGISDHVALWADIPLSVAFGHDFEMGVRRQRRRLKGNDPRVVARYLQVLERECKAMWLEERVEALFYEVCDETGSVVQWTVANEREWEAIDRKLTAAMNKAENECRRLRCGGISWTPYYSQLRAAEKAWVLKIRGRVMGGRSGFFQRVCRKAGIVIPRQMSEVESRLHLEEVRQALQEYQVDHEQRRQNWLESMAEAHAERAWQQRGGSGERSEEEEADFADLAENWYRRLIRQEEQRRAAFAVRVATGRLPQRQGITALIAPGPQGERMRLDQRKDMERALLIEAARRGNQAAGSSFLQEPLATLVGPTGISEFTRQVVSGSYPQVECADEYAQSMLGYFGIGTGTPMRLKWEADRYTRAWRRVCEQTSSSPFSPHMGHYKAALYSDTVHQIHSRMAWLPFVTGYSPQRWQRAVGVVIYKQPGNINIERMRGIDLFAADYNMNNKILGREMMSHAEQQGRVAPEQYGSRKAHSAVAHALNKQVAYSLVRVLRTPAAMCSNDAQGCYDRIVHSVASLSMQRVGVPTAPIASMFTTLQRLQRFVRTAYGDSPEALDAAGVNPIAIQGVGQGNGAAPQVWALVSTVLLNMLRDAGFGARFVAPLSREMVFYAAFSFVDDTDLLVTDAERLRSAEMVAQAMQQALLQWEGALRASGGALEPLKSHWYLIDFEEVSGEWRYRQLGDTKFDLEMRGPSGRIAPLEQVPVFEARRTLGVFLAPNGDSDKQYQVLMAKAQQWADAIRTNHVSRRYAWQAYSTVLQAQLAYPLAATSLSRKQCESIDRVVRRVVLPHGGVVRTFPTALAYGSVTMQGLGLLKLYDRQGLAAVGMLLHSLLGPTDLLRQQLVILLELQQVEVGVPFCLLEADYSVYGHLATSTWLTSVWKFLSVAKIRFSGGKKLQGKREGDGFLMPQLARHYKGRDLRRLNNCRIFLQVLTLADICSVDGNAFLLAAWEGRPWSSDQWWPRRPAPRPQDWQLWRRALTECFGFDKAAVADQLSQSRVLAQRLGDWWTDKLFEWEFHEASGSLFRRGAVVQCFRPQGARTTRHCVGVFVLADEGVQLPRDTVPASVVPFPGGLWRLEGVSRRSPGRIEESAPEWMSQMLVTMPSDAGDAVLAAVAAGQAVAVTDGSFRDGFGTAAVVIEGPETAQVPRVMLQLVVPGLASQQSALRSELAGLLALVRWLSTFASEHGIESGSVAVACDNIAAVNAASYYNSKVSLKAAQYDLIAALRASIRASTIQWSFRHVKGHVQGPHLSHWERLNHVADAACKRFWAERHSMALWDQEVVESEWSVWVGETKVCSRFTATVAQWLQCCSASRYWDRRMGSRASQLVDWEATGRAVRSLPRARQVWLAKQSSGMCATGVRMCAQGLRPSACCPRCELDEDSEHVLCCQGVGMDTRWQGHMSTLHAWLQGEDTDPYIISDLMAGLTQWRSYSAAQRKLHSVLRTGNELPQLPLRREYMRHQHFIGWRALMEGRLAASWGRAQQQYWLRHGSLKSVRRWAAALITRLLLISWDFWDHRNHILHGSEDSLAEYMLNSRISAVYSAGPGSLPAYCHSPFTGSLQTLLRHPLPFKRDWLWTVESVRAYQQHHGQSASA
jgi:hypothetical protein